MHNRTRIAAAADGPALPGPRGDGAHTHGAGHASMLPRVLTSLVTITFAVTIVTCTVLAVIVVLLLHGPAGGGGGGALSSPIVIETASVFHRPLAPPVGPTPRVALLFFGLTRSLAYTLPSIEANVVAPLRDHGVETEVFLHTYNDTDDASSAGTDNSEWHLLNPSKYSITSQQTFIDATQCALPHPPGLHAACWPSVQCWQSHCSLVPGQWDSRPPGRAAADGVCCPHAPR